MKKPCEPNAEYCNTVLKQVAQTAVENYAGIDNLAEMRVSLVNRFDLGLAKGSFSREATRTIEDWRTQLR